MHEHGNPHKKNAGGDSVQLYAQGPEGILLHSTVIDTGDGNYTVSAWPVVAGPYHLSVLVSALEPSRWALGYRQGVGLSVFRVPSFCACARLHSKRGVGGMSEHKQASPILSCSASPPERQNPPKIKWRYTCTTSSSATTTKKRQECGASDGGGARVRQPLPAGGGGGSRRGERLSGVRGGDRFAPRGRRVRHVSVHDKVRRGAFLAA